MPSVRAFSWTMATFVGSVGLGWVNRTWLLEFYLSLVNEGLSEVGVVYPHEAGLFALTVKVTVWTAVLLTLPVFYAEAWLLACRLGRRDDARRLTVPFTVLSTGALLLGVWLAPRAVSHLVLFL